MVIKSKKGIEFSSEMLVAVFAIILIAIGGFISFNFSTTSKEGYYKMAPELTYQFPAVFVHSFLMVPLSEEEKKELSLDIDTKYFVKDLMVLATDESKKVLEVKKNIFIDEYKESSSNLDSSINLYKKFSKKKNLNSDNLLCYTTNDVISKKLEDEIKLNNYFFYVKNLQGGYSMVRFYCN